jgi:hypothetical protein
MSIQWTHASFAENLNSTFALQHPQWGTVSVELIHVSDLRETPRQRMYSLIFRGTLEQPLQQGLYSLSHEKLEHGDLFIVPIAREADGFHYEAVFNTLVK